MKHKSALVEFSVIPVGGGEHISGEVARCTRVVRESGMKNELHAMGTILEGDLDESMDVIRKCLEAILEQAPRATATVRIDVRSSPGGGIQKNVDAVEQKLATTTA